MSAFLLPRFSDGSSVVLEVDCFNNFIMAPRFVVDMTSLAFRSAVSLIALSVFVFAESYMLGDKHTLRFGIILFSFVVSMIVLIYSHRYLMVIVG